MTKKLLFAAVILLALLLVWVIWFWQPAGDQAHQHLSLAAAPVGGDFTLHSADGPVSLKDLRGKVVLVYFGYTFCPDICPDLPRLHRAGARPAEQGRTGAHPGAVHLRRPGTRYAGKTQGIWRLLPPQQSSA